jgi:transposase
MPELEIFANVGWLKTRIDGFVREDGTDISGREQAHAPNYTANIGLQGSLWDNWAWSVQADAKDSFYFSNSHDQRAQSSVQWHAQLSYYWSNWQLKLWGRNLTDEQTDIRGFYFGNDPRDEYVTETYRQYGEPRRVGFTAEYKF